MKRVYIATTQLALDQAKAAGRVPAYSLAQAMSERPEADEFVFYGPDAQSRMKAHQSSTGMPIKDLAWYDSDTASIRDFHWDVRRSMADLPPTAPQKFMSCGISGLSRVLSWRFPELVVVAGPYGSGKSLFAQILAQDFARQHGHKVLFTCWEDQHDEIRDGLIRYRDTAANFKTDEERDRFIDLFRTTIVRADTERSLDKHFEALYDEHAKFGTKFFVLDPWNSFRHHKGKRTDGEYAIDVLMEGQKIVEELGIILMITTHVAAEYFDAKGDIKPFKVGNAFGTSQFGNFAHRGFCVMRTDTFTGQQQMLVRQDKVKLEDRMGHDYRGEPIVLQRRMGQRETLVFNYSSKSNTIYWDKETSMGEKARKIWRG